MKKLVLIDGNHLVHRAFWAIKSKLLSPAGEPTNAVYGFTSMLINILNQEKPDAAAIAFDEDEKTFRHKEYKEYKATRVSAPQELYDQIPQIREVVKAFSIPDISMQGYEADDIIGTLAKECHKNKDMKILIVTGDKDALQLVNSRISIAVPHKGYRDPVYFDEKKLKEKYGLAPTQIIDFKGLAGDASDNLKGCPGIGEKGALKLLHIYRTIEEIYSHIDEIKDTTKKKLIQGKKSVFQSRKLATLCANVPVKFSIEKCYFDINYNNIEKIFKKLGFKTLLKRIQKYHAHYKTNHKKQKKEENQLAMF